MPAFFRAFVTASIFWAFCCCATFASAFSISTASTMMAWSGVVVTLPVPDTWISLSPDSSGVSAVTFPITAAQRTIRAIPRSAAFPRMVSIIS